MAVTLGAQPVREGGDPRRARLPRHRAARDRRLQRQRRAARRLRRRPPARRQHQVPHHRRHEEHRERVRQGDGRRRARAGVVRHRRWPSTSSTTCRRSTGPASRSRPTRGTGSATTGSPHPHAFARRGSYVRTATVTYDGDATCGSSPACASCVVLKTTDSEFHTFYRTATPRSCPPTTGSWPRSVTAQWCTPTPTPTGARPTTRCSPRMSEHLRRPPQPGAAADHVRDGRGDDRRAAGDRRGAVLDAEQAPLRRRPQPVRPGEPERGLPRRRPALRLHRGHHPQRRRPGPRRRAFDPGQGW